ncbi:hypothetical protein ABI59_23720 [Acidobacteria bacterium Mor1]|nr:hypothetical protein ABI59_23720 [Acidobacteria bacterium Mor1]
MVGFLAPRLLRLLSRLPLRAAQGLGGFIGGLMARLPLTERKVTRVNLQIAFPEWSDARRREVERRSLAHSGRAFAEIGALWFWSRERIDPLIRKVDGEHLIADTLAEGRSVVLAIPHLGSWEVIGPFISTRYPMTVLYRSPRIAEIDWLTRHGRGRFGAELAAAGRSAVRTLRKAVDQGRTIAILPDQDPGVGIGVFAPFFGKQANTMVLLSRLATRGPRVVLAWGERLPRGQGFHLHFSDASDGVYDPDVVASATALNQDVERLVRSCPEQYLWSYKRFRMRPPGDPSPYKSNS